MVLLRGHNMFFDQQTQINRNSLNLYINLYSNSVLHARMFILQEFSGLYGPVLQEQVGMLTNFRSSLNKK